MPARTKKAIQEAEVHASPSASDESGAEIAASDDTGSEDEDGHVNESGSGSESGDRSEGEGESDSDSLDSTAPRKRRRVSPAPDEDGEEEEDVPKASVSFISAPSRIKRKTASDGKTTQPKPTSGEASQPADVFGGATTAPTDPNTTFESLGVHPWLVQSLTNMAIRRPTGIQKGCIPEILRGRDCIGGSRTGSGKTVAFAVPILQRWAEDPSAIFAVVLTPTR